MSSKSIAAALEAQLQKTTNVGQAARSLEPKFVLEPNNRDWVIENHKDRNQETPLKVEGVRLNQNVYIRNCENVIVQVCGKVNNVVIENCKAVRVVLESVISAISLIRTDKTKVQITGVAPGVSLDQCSGVDVYFSWNSREAQITSCQITDVNVHYPVDEKTLDEWIELPVPAQFVHYLAPSSNTLVSKVSDLYG